MKIGDAMTNWRFSAAGAALLVVMWPAVVGANPIGAVGARTVVEDHPARLVQQVAVRCWWRDGVRRCRPAWSGGSPRVYGYYRYYEYAPSYGNPRPEAYRTGTAEWWRAMERWGRTGIRP